MRFLADMGISPSMVNELRAHGHDAVHLRELGMQRASDKRVLAKALSEERIVLTSDLDFGYLMAISGLKLPSIVIFRLSDMRPDNVAAHLHRVIDRLSVELAAGCVVAVSDTSFRARRLPIREGP